MNARDPHILGPGLLPTPFSADEIRAGCPVGRTIRLLVEREGVEPSLRTNRFIAADDDGAIIESQRLTIGGEPIGEPVADRSTWLQLQEHAAFPADRTTRTTTTVELPFGVLECLRYDMVEGDTTNTFWFARVAPGMPVKYQTVEAGRVTSTVTMTANELP